MEHALWGEGVEAGKDVSFHLAMEEHLARNHGGEYFFLWQVAPSVVFGRNQDINAEVDLDYCRREGIGVYRRKSGGGCIYADTNNVMFSHIATVSGTVADTFGRYTRRIADMLQSIGIAAECSGRNDILVAGRKISGHAFYTVHCGDGDTRCTRAIVHGTMLFDIDHERMCRALTPSQAKMEAKGVQSVRSHVTSVREHLPAMALEQFKALALKHLATGEKRLGEADLEAVERYAAELRRPEWIFGKGSAQRRAMHRIEGVGELAVELTTARDARGTPCIATLDLHGDYFVAGDVDRELLRPLQGCPLAAEALTERLRGVKTGEVILGLKPQQLVNLILNT